MLDAQTESPKFGSPIAVASGVHLHIPRVNYQWAGSQRTFPNLDTAVLTDDIEHTSAIPGVCP